MQQKISIIARYNNYCERNKKNPEMFSNFPTHYERQLAIEIYLKETLIIETASVSKQNLNVGKKVKYELCSVRYENLYSYTFIITIYYLKRLRNTYACMYAK